MGLLPARIDFPGVGTGYKVVQAGAYEECPQGEQLLSLSDGSLRLCLSRRDDALFIFGPARGCALHILLLQEFAKLAARKLLAERLFSLGERFGYGGFAFRVGDQRKRWGSCSRRGGRKPKICLNWRGLLLTSALLDHLCLHELCHLQVMNHSPAFHALLRSLNPEARRDELALGKSFVALPPWSVHASHFTFRRKR